MTLKGPLEAVKNGNFPDDFNFLAFKDIKDNDGNTPAKIAEKYGHLPKRFENAEEAEAFNFVMDEKGFRGPRG